MLMLFNYHTHTHRCNHATGSEREYIESAITSGMKTLGFSDHAPYLFPDGSVSHFRMKNDQLFAYAETIRALAKEYEKDIRILCGFELEYYPEYHENEIRFLKQVNPDYLILGQHFIHNEKFLPHTHAMAKKDEYLIDYVTQILAAIDTGDFLYIAHPDIIGTDYSPECVEREFTRLCQGAKDKGIPLELNLLGIREKRRYPCCTFFKIAAKVGNEVIIGLDAHSPSAFFNPAEETARAMAQILSLRLIDKPIL